MIFCLSVFESWFGLAHGMMFIMRNIGRQTTVGDVYMRASMNVVCGYVIPHEILDILRLLRGGKKQRVIISTAFRVSITIPLLS